MTDEMKPVRCGCGGRPIIEYGEDGICRVRCSFCLTGTVYHRNKSEAVATWNRAMSGNLQECAENARCTERTAKVETVEKPNVYKCSECGQYFHSTAWGSPVMYCPSCGARLEWR